MKKICILLFAFSCLPVFAAGQAATGQAAGQPAAQPAAAQPAAAPATSGQAVVEEIIARVNNQIITRSEFARSKDQLKEEVKQQDPNNADKAYGEREKDILRDLIDQQLLHEKGKDIGNTGDTHMIKAIDQMRKEIKLDSLEGL
jgi:peptidyl-prolyl cis-trans isomerase SurA